MSKKEECENKGECSNIDPSDAESLIALGLLKIQCLLLSFSSVQLKRVTDSAASHEWLACTLT